MHEQRETPGSSARPDTCGEGRAATRSRAELAEVSAKVGAVNARPSIKLGGASNYSPREKLIASPPRAAAYINSGNAKLPSAMSMPRSNPLGKSVRFAVFEVDLAAGELRKNGIRVRLQEQPFQMLVYLLDRAGEVVTREELCQKLWPADTFVDFDHSLNTAVLKLRDALGDSAVSPRYIETLARRGYRFLAPVQRAEEKSPAQDFPPAGVNALASAASPEVSFDPDLEVPVPRRSLTRSLFGLIQLMYLTFYVIALFRLTAIERVLSTFLPWWESRAIFVATLVTAGAGIPLRCYLISAAGFDHKGLGTKFKRLFPVILALDQLWAVAPFLLTEKIGFGAAFAATAALLYVPFSERTLVRLAYPAQKVLLRGDETGTEDRQGGHGS